MSARTFPIAAFLCMLTAVPAPAAADPVRVTGGTVQVETFLNEARITFSGNGLFLHTTSEDFHAALNQAPFTLSMPLNLGAEWVPTATTGGEAVFNGVTYPEVFIDGGSFGTFTTPSITVTPGQTI